MKFIDVCCYVHPETSISCAVTEDLFEISYGPEVGDYTQACRPHLGLMLDDDIVSTVFPVKQMTPLGELRGLLWGT